MPHPSDFYTYMNYPLPKPIDFFSSQKKSIQATKITRNKENPYTNKYIQKIKKHSRVYKSIPFVKAIYLCDGISFNASKKTSDIDLFFVVEDGCIRRARLYSVLLFWILGVKRSFHHKAGKFDLIFYVTQSHTNLEKIAISPSDPYLYHWLSHLIPIYTEEQSYSIYKHNDRLYNIFPNFPKDKHIVDLGIQIAHGSSTFKKIGQYILGAKALETIIGRLRSYIIKLRANRRKHRLEDVIITDNMLKFHKDRRTEIAKALHSK